MIISIYHTESQSSITKIAGKVNIFLVLSDGKHIVYSTDDGVYGLSIDEEKEEGDGSESISPSFNFPSSIIYLLLDGSN